MGGGAGQMMLRDVCLTNYFIVLKIIMEVRMISKNDLLRCEKDNRFIYHYTKFDALIKILLNKNLLFNRLNEKNDPFEFMRYIHNVRWNDFTNHHDNIDGEEHDKIDKFKDDVNSIIKMQYKICSFCIDYEDISDNNYVSYMNKGFSRSRMWSQYGEDHKGVCIIFNKDKILNTISENYKCVFAQEISYNDDLSISFDETEITSDALKNITPIKWVNTHIEKYLFLKLEDYKNEYEYRIAIHDNQNEVLFIDFNDGIDGIILGKKFPSEYEKMLGKLLIDFNFPVFKIDWFYGIPNNFLNEINLRK